jgi:hypothetical protein
MKVEFDSASTGWWCGITKYWFRVDDEYYAVCESEYSKPKITDAIGNDANHLTLADLVVTDEMRREARKPPVDIDDEDDEDE